MNLLNLFRKFEEKYRDLKVINSEWYVINCGVFSNCKEVRVRNNNHEYNEEWYRARFVWSLVESNCYPNKNICVEFSIPKGSEGAKSLRADIVIFKDKKWKESYDEWDKKSALPEKLAQNMLIVAEAKDNPNKVESTITKQMGEAMNSYIGEQIFGIYFDNSDNVLLFRKEGTNSIKRYNSEKIIDGENYFFRVISFN